MVKKTTAYVLLFIMGLLLVLPLSAKAALDDLGTIDVAFSPTVSAHFGASTETVIGAVDGENAGFGGKIAYETGAHSTLSFSAKTDMGLNMFEGTKPNHQVGVKFTSSF